MNPNGSVTEISELRYKAWGETRFVDGISPTDRTYTGQRASDAVGLLFYNARWYDSALGRFISADSIIPDPYNPLDYDRFNYVRNNAVKYTDPSGHKTVCKGNICSDDVPYQSLTRAGDKVKAGTPGEYTRKFGGAELHQVYLLMKAETNAWWYQNGDFSIEMFIGLLIIQEANYGNNVYDNEAGNVISLTSAQNVYVGGNRPATCPGGPGDHCFGGALNYWAAYSEVAQDLIRDHVWGNVPINEYRGLGNVGDLGPDHALHSISVEYKN